MLSILLPAHNEEKINEFVDALSEKIMPAQIIVCNDRNGRGKGWAVRQALLHAHGDIIAMIDGDGEIPARMLTRLIPFLEDFDVVVGSKRVWKAPWTRKIITHLSRMFIRLVFGLQVDTQTGIKLYRRNALTTWRSNGFIFDVEILALAKRRGFRMIEVPIEAEIKKQISIKALWHTLTESMILFFRLSFLAEK